MIVRGNQNGYKTTFRAISYSYSGYLFGIIPFIGLIIGEHLCFHPDHHWRERGPWDLNRKSNFSCPPPCDCDLWTHSYRYISWRSCLLDQWGSSVVCAHKLEFKNLLSIKRAFMPFFFKNGDSVHPGRIMLVDTLRRGAVAWKSILKECPDVPSFTA